MDKGGLAKQRSESQDSDEPAPPGTSSADLNKATKTKKPSSVGFKLKTSSKGVENAKKRLRAFSIQKKTPITPVTVPKGPSGGSTTVYIGKLSGIKPSLKPDEPKDGEQKKLVKPPKPGSAWRKLQDSYTELQKRTLTEIEDMKRKMELVDLGIPLGLICPSASNDKAMPTKAMPPIKTFLDPTKLDEIIREAKKAKAEGREFKFDYHKLLPDYDNPFQRKREESEKGKSEEREFRKKFDERKDRDYEKRKLDKFERPEKFERLEKYEKPEKFERSEKFEKPEKYEKDTRRYSNYRRDEKDKRKDDYRPDRDKYKPKEKDERKDKEQEDKSKRKEKDAKETDVNLSDYLVCDSWSLDNDASSTSPRLDEILKQIPIPKEARPKEQSLKKERYNDSPLLTPIRKLEKLQPVIDSFKFEIDPNEDELLDMFDENSELEKYKTRTRERKEDDIYDSPIDMKLFDFDQNTKESNDALTDDTFLESVINEIKQEAMSDDESQDKGLVEYDSPSRESESPPIDPRLSVTPELDDRMRDLQSSKSDYSDGYRSTESGYKSTESGYKSSASYQSGDSKGDSYRMSMEKEIERLDKSTVDSLETWSFVLKICQPLLFRHDKNKCYRETRTAPKLWFTENPKLCTCVKDRAIVYDELETCKMGLVDRVYGCDQIPEVVFPNARTWYPRFAHCLLESSTVPLEPSSEWEADDSQTETPLIKDKRRSTTPLRSEEIYLDREYQRFMQAVWPEVSESKAGTPRSTTPVRQEARKKKAEDKEDDKKKAKKIKLSSEGWSQESEVDEEQEKSKHKIKGDKVKRKRKHSPSPASESDDDKKRRKAMKKKAKDSIPSKSKLEAKLKTRKKYLKKLKEKQKKKKRQVSEDEDIEKENKKKQKKLRKKKLAKKKKAQKKKKAKTKPSSSSSTSSSSDAESEEDKKRKKKKSGELKKKKRKKSSSDSTQSEDLFDVNILNNIKTERLTDDEKRVEFSPRRQKPREIINVKELQNDFVGNNIHIKQEVIEEQEEYENERIKMDSLELNSQEKEFATERAPDVPSLPEVPSLQEVPSIAEVPIVLKVEEKEEILFEDIPRPITPTEHTQQDADAHTSQVTAVKLLDSSTQSSLDKIPEHLQTNQVDIKADAMPISTLYKEPQDLNIPIPVGPLPDESNLSQCSSQESTTSKDVPYEKDDSHLRPSSQNSNYSFNDVISASQHYQKEEEDKFHEAYEQGNYEMYEQLAMAYQSDVAKQSSPSLSAGSPSLTSQRIETVVRARSRGEIKCDWRAGDDSSAPPNAHQRPSRWGLKPGEVNIVLTGGGEEFPIQSVPEPVYQIQTIANRTENNTSGSYDEAYEDMYGASDRLQYGDCFGTDVEPQPPEESETAAKHSSAFDDRINQVLRTTVLGDVAKESEEADPDKESTDRGILVTKPEAKGGKRVSFADGYKPGQDSDVEEPPIKKKKKPRRNGCAWPCPASHPDHVPLWDALPPPPAPPGSPPPPHMAQQLIQMMQQNMIPNMLMQQQPPNLMQPPNMMQQPPQMMQQPPQMMQQPPQMMQQPPQMMQQPPQMMQQPPQMMQQPPNMMQQPPNMMPQQPPNMQQPPQMMQQPPQMMQQPPQMMQQPPQIMQQTHQMLQQQAVKNMMSTPPFPMPQKIDPSVSLPNFLPPEPPPGLIKFQ